MALFKTFENQLTQRFTGLRQQLNYVHDVKSKVSESVLAYQLPSMCFLGTHHLFGSSFRRFRHQKVGGMYTHPQCSSDVAPHVNLASPVNYTIFFSCRLFGNAEAGSTIGWEYSQYQKFRKSCQFLNSSLPFPATSAPKLSLLPLTLQPTTSDAQELAASCTALPSSLGTLIHTS